MESAPLTCIADDAADQRFILQQLFNRFLPTYPVRFFADGQALLDGLVSMNQRPGLIVLDRHMPSLDGHQTLLHLKAHSSYQLIPVVMMSADSSAAEIEGCYKAGANSFLVKSTDFNELKVIMTAVCQYWLTINQLAPTH